MAIDIKNYKADTDESILISSCNGQLAGSPYNGAHTKCIPCMMPIESMTYVSSKSIFNQFSYPLSLPSSNVPCIFN